ncbi:hypothetical protein [Cesiribacter sp. SM1]|uniref:hypothetical protein n=1 Tax=Cesiribacter sp. SM1 TaxID=2861196 RepID=UPI001CD3CD53|nr:hypothetical protein [Cesiribacter sp. SM1]
MRWISELLVLIVVIGCHAKQPPYKEIHSKYLEYKDFAVVDEQIFALDTENKLVEINPVSEGYQLIETHVQAFGSIQEDQIIVVTQGGEIKSYAPNKNVWTTWGITTLAVEAVIPVGENIYLWTDSGMVDYKTGTCYERDSSYSKQLKHPDLLPQAIAVDKDENIWLSFHLGEAIWLSSMLQVNNTFILNLKIMILTFWPLHLF